MTSPDGKLIVGCGYLGARVAEKWRAAGEAVWAVTRSESRAKDLAAAGYTPLVADVLEPASLDCLPKVGTVLYAVGFDRTAGRDIHDVYANGLANILVALAHSPPRRLIYISSTGVYGDAPGHVDEDTPGRPQTAGGAACLAAEERLLASPMAARAVVLRLAGMYGPARVPRRESLLAGEPIPASPDACVHLIHVEDAASAVLAAEAFIDEHPERLPRTIVVADGRPVVRGEFYAELARLSGAPAPRFVAPSQPPRRGGADRRISNARMLADLRFDLRYPSYREGLAAISAAEANDAGMSARFRKISAE